MPRDLSNISADTPAIAAPKNGALNTAAAAKFAPGLCVVVTVQHLGSLDHGEHHRLIGTGQSSLGWGTD